MPASNSFIAPVANVATSAASYVQGLLSPLIGNDVLTDEAVQSVSIVLLYIANLPLYLPHLTLYLPHRPSYI